MARTGLNRTVASLSPMSYTSPTVFHVETPAMPTQPPKKKRKQPVHGVQDVVDVQWSGMAIWSRRGSDVSASVQASDGVSDSYAHFPLEILLVEYLLVRLNRMFSTWPTHLRLEIMETGVHTPDFRAWLLRHQPPVARIKCAPDTDNHDFDELIKSLRELGSVRRRLVVAFTKIVSHGLAGRGCAMGDPRRRLRSRLCSGAAS